MKLGRKNSLRQLQARLLTHPTYNSPFQATVKMNHRLDDDDFTIESRARSFTWPMRPFSMMDLHLGSYQEPTVGQLLAGTPSGSNVAIVRALSGGHSAASSTGAIREDEEEELAVPAAKRKRCRRRPPDQLAQKKPNPWGEESYSDLIAKSLESAPGGRLKLNEIYQWFVDNIAYFHDRSSQEDAAGWKVLMSFFKFAPFQKFFLS